MRMIDNANSLTIHARAGFLRGKKCRKISEKHAIAKQHSPMHTQHIHTRTDCTSAAKVSVLSGRLTATISRISQAAPATCFFGLRLSATVAASSRRTSLHRVRRILHIQCFQRLSVESLLGCLSPPLLSLAEVPADYLSV